MPQGTGRAVETGLHSIVMPQLFTLFTPTPKARPLDATRMGMPSAKPV